jgi:hypothetical protein
MKISPGAAQEGNEQLRQANKSRSAIMSKERHPAEVF